MKLLAFDTSTDSMSLALTDGARTWQHTGPGGAQASSTLIPAILDLLGQAGLALADLDALVFGRGPGSFTGLRVNRAVVAAKVCGGGRQPGPRASGPWRKSRQPADSGDWQPGSVAIGFPAAGLARLRVSTHCGGRPRTRH